MLFCDEDNKTIQIKSLEDDFTSEMFWTLDLNQKDFFLSDLILLGENEHPSMTLSILGDTVVIPTEWNILVYSPETSVVDMIQTYDLTRSSFSLFVYDHTTNKIIDGRARVIDYKPEKSFRFPLLNKNNMLCYPIKDRYWIMIAPTDTHSKYLKDNITVGDFLYY